MVKVVSVLLSVGGVAMVAFYSSKAKCIPISSLSPSNTSSPTNSSDPPHFVLGSPHHKPCTEQSTWYGYVVSWSHTLLTQVSPLTSDLCADAHCQCHHLRCL